MIAASLGWGVWWIEVVLTRFRPESAPSLGVVSWVAGAFALVGFLAALWTIRAKAAWILITLVPLLANTSLLAMPWITKKLHWMRTETASVLPLDQVEQGMPSMRPLDRMEQELPLEPISPR